MNPIYRGQYPPKNTDVIWLKDKTAYTFSNGGWAPIDNNSSYSRTQIDDMLKLYGKALSYNEDTGRLSIMNGEEELSYVTIKITLEDTLSETSENGIKNKAVYAQYMNEKETKLLLQKVGVIDWENRDFTIQMLEDGKIQWFVASDYLMYSINGMGDYVHFPDDYSHYSQGQELRVNKGDLISFYTIPVEWLNRNGRPFEITGKCNVGGKLGSLHCKGSTTQGVDGQGQYQNLLQMTDVVSAKNLNIHNNIVGGFALAGMFSSCLFLKEIPKIEFNSTLNLYNYFNKMFSNCTSLKEVEIDINSINDYACQQMFLGCTALSSVKCTATTVVTNGTINWLQGVSATGTFYKNSQMSSWATGASGIPEGWTVENI